MAGFIHHINILVEDLDRASHAFCALLHAQPTYESLPQRQANTARFKCGDTYIVLVSPTSPDSVLTKRLASHGEGLFLISFGVPDLDGALNTLINEGAIKVPEQERQGLSGWRVQDVELNYSVDAVIQLCETQFISK